MSYETDILVTQLVNENTSEFPYEKRCEMARLNASAISWVMLLSRYAAACRRDYEQAFSTVQVLQAAADIAEYYETHVREMDAA